MTILYDEGGRIMRGNDVKTTDEEGTDEVEDLTTKVIDDTTSDTDKAGKEDKGALSDADKAKIETMQALLDEHDIESPEDLKRLVKNLATLKDKVGDVDLEELKSNSDLLKRYQKAWAEEEARKKEDDETPGETIARLKKEKEEIESKREADNRRQQEAQESTTLLRNFSDSVKSAIKADKDFPAEYHGILTEFLGVDNEINEIDLDDKAGIKRVAKAAAKKILAHDQAVIKRYLAGKSKIVKISTSSGGPAHDAPVKITSKNAKAIAVERLKGFLGKE
jgi:hypothetical protein